MTFLVFVAYAALQTVMPGQVAPAPATAQPATSGNAVIRGRILRGDGRPLPRALITLMRLDLPGIPRRAESDDEGRFELPQLPAGSYRLSVMRVGYDTIEFGQHRASERGEPIALAPDEIRERVDIALPRTGAVAGKVVDESGEPVEGASVRIEQVGYVAGQRQLVGVPMVFPERTNDLGRFRIFGLQPGRYIVSASISEVVSFGQATDLPGYALTYFPGTPNSGDAQFVAVGLSQEVLNVDFALAHAPTARVTGTATNAAGEPIRGGLVLIPSRRSNRVRTAPVGARISPNGSFEFPNVAPGEYIVQAYKGRSNASTEGEFASEFVTVSGADVTGVTLHTSRGSMIAGRFTFDGDAPPKAGEVELSPLPSDPDRAPASGGPPARAEIHDDWTFDMAGINGPRRLRLTHAPAGWSLKSILVNGIDVTDTPLMFGGDDRSVRDVEVVLTKRAAVVTGTVADDRGAADGAAHVIAFASDRDLRYPGTRFLRHAIAQPDGSFSLDGLPPGTYDVVAVNRLAGNGDDGEWQDTEVLQALEAGATLVTLSNGQASSVKLRTIVR